MNRHRYRIAMVAACPFPSLRGSQVLIRELAEALGAAGHEVHVVTYPAGEHLVRVKHFTIHRSRPIFGLEASRSWWAKLLLDVALMVTLYRVVRRHAIDVIHAHNYEGPLVAYVARLLLRVPIVYHSHNAMVDELPYYFRGRAARRLARWAGAMLDGLVPRSADHCIALTPELESYLRRCLVSPNRVSVIPPAAAAAGAEPSAPALLSGKDVVLYAGNLDPYQRLDVLLRAFSLVRETRSQAVLVVVVHSVHSPAVRRRMREIAALPGVELIEASTFGATRALMRRADVVVCPRSSWSGFPIKLINFMSYGRPLVVCKGAAKVIADGATGVVVADDDDQAMAEAIEQLLDDPARRATLGAAARKTMQAHYTWPVVLPQIESVYARVAGETCLDGRVAPRRKWAKMHNNPLMAAGEDRISAPSPARTVGGE